MCIAVLFATPVVDCRQDTEVFPLLFVTSCRRFASVWSSARLRGCLRPHIQDATYAWTPRRRHAQVPGPKFPGRRSFGKPRIRNCLAISGFIFVKDVVNIVRPAKDVVTLSEIVPANMGSTTMGTQQKSQSLHSLDSVACNSARCHSARLQNLRAPRHAQRNMTDDDKRGSTSTQSLGVADCVGLTELSYMRLC